MHAWIDLLEHTQRQTLYAYSTHMDACMNRHQSWHTHTHANTHSVVADSLFSFPNHSHFYNNPPRASNLCVFLTQTTLSTDRHTHTHTLFPCHCPWMPRRDALKGAWRTGYHFQRGFIGPCSPRPTGYVCVMMRRRGWGWGALITCVLLLLWEAQRSPPPRG